MQGLVNSIMILVLACFIAGCVAASNYSVTDFGAKGDGVTDDTKVSEINTSSLSFFFYVCMRVYVKHIHEEISTSFCMICFHYNHICSVFYSSGVLGYMECNMSEFCILHSPHPGREDVPVESHRLPGSLPVLRPCSGIASACRRQQVLESSALSLSLSRAVG